MPNTSMHRRSMLLTATALALCGCATPSAQEQVSTPALPTPRFPKPSSDFDAALFLALAREPGNVFVSPYSVSSAFELIYPGAAGVTAGEMATVFGFDPSATAQARQWRAGADTIRGQTGGSELTIASAAWVEQTMSLRPDYAHIVHETLGGAIQTVPFIANQPAALRSINAWASNQTRGRIPEILTEQDPDRRLVLTNAVYFKGKWADPFAGGSTRDGDFFTGASTKVPARLMHQLTTARYVDMPSFQAVELEYDQGAFALSIFLPRERTGLQVFERQLAGEGRLDMWMQQLASAQRARIDLTLPKVRMRANYTLNDSLKGLGLRQAFTPEADFSAVTADETLMISQVIQRTFLDMDEEGTEAAAVTAVEAVATAAISPPPPPPIEFKADHPFFIVLHHRPTQTRLFLGRISTV